MSHTPWQSTNICVCWNIICYHIRPKVCDFHKADRKINVGHLTIICVYCIYKHYILVFIIDKKNSVCLPNFVRVFWIWNALIIMGYYFIIMRTEMHTLLAKINLIITKYDRLRRNMAWKNCMIFQTTGCLENITRTIYLHRFS